MSRFDNINGVKTYLQGMVDEIFLTLPGLLVKDSQVYYVGSLKRKDSRRVFSLFGLDTGKSNDHLTVWFRVRELRK